MPKRKPVVDDLLVENIVGEMRNAFREGASPVRYDEDGAGHFDKAFRASVRFALDYPLDWKEDRPFVLLLFGITGLLARARVVSPLRRDGPYITKKDLIACLTAVRDTTCPPGFLGRWCNFIDGGGKKKRKPAKKTVKKSAKKAAKK
jgi:hypothetical protein